MLACANFQAPCQSEYTGIIGDVDIEVASSCHCEFPRSPMQDVGMKSWAKVRGSGSHLECPIAFTPLSNCQYGEHTAKDSTWLGCLAAAGSRETPQACSPSCYKAFSATRTTPMVARTCPLQRGPPRTGSPRIAHRDTSSEYSRATRGGRFRVLSL